MQIDQVNQAQEEDQDQYQMDEQAVDYSQNECDEQHHSNDPYDKHSTNQQEQDLIDHMEFEFNAKTDHATQNNMFFDATDSQKQCLSQLKEATKLESKTLRWYMPIIGEVPMMFYIPECGQIYEELKYLIEIHGGMVIEQHECFSFQIKPENAKLKMKDFYQGSIYICNWIRDSINCNKSNPMEIGGTKMMAKKDDNFLSECNNVSSKKLNIGKKKKFTIVEGIKLFQIMSTNNTQNLNKTSFWLKIQDQRLIPERTADQMKRFWNEHENYTIEQWLAKAIHQNLDFSFSVKQIPSPDFVQTFRKKYECEFLRLETLDPTHLKHVDNNDRGSNFFQNGQASTAQSSHFGSINLGRNVSMASQSEGQLDMILLKNLQDDQAKPDGLKTTGSAETQSSTQVQISQNTNSQINSNDVSAFPKQKFSHPNQSSIDIKDIYSKTNVNPFAQSNLFNNFQYDLQPVNKIPKVEYEISYNDFGGCQSDEKTNIDDDHEDNERNTPIINYSIWSDNACLMKENRPCKTLDSIFEKKMNRRLARFHAKPLDRTQYEKELLEKQLDLETIIISLHEEDASVKQAFLRECGGQCGSKPYKRTTKKEANEEGRFRRLIKEIEEMAYQHGIELDEAFTLFESVSCSKSHFKEVLEKKSFTTWSSIDDLGLRQSEDSPEYEHLLKLKGVEEVERRKNFLGLNISN